MISYELAKKLKDAGFPQWEIKLGDERSGFYFTDGGTNFFMAYFTRK